MKPMKNDWYKKIWTLDIQNQSWVEDTKNRLIFLELVLIAVSEVNGSEKYRSYSLGREQNIQNL